MLQHASTFGTTKHDHVAVALCELPVCICVPCKAIVVLEHAAESPKLLLQRVVDDYEAKKVDLTKENEAYKRALLDLQVSTLLAM